MLYGMTYMGGSSNAGVLFSYNLTTNKDSTLLSFASGTSSATGNSPRGSVVLDPVNGLLYGMTESGGSGYGVLFSYDLSTGTEKVITKFSPGTSGSYPYGTLTYDPVNGMLYGDTHSGGSGSDGVFFKLNPNNNNDSIIYNYTNASGSAPEYGAPLFDSVNGLIYGLTEGGGSGGYGTFYSINPVTGKDSVIKNFTGANGQNPFSTSVIYDKFNGLIYGTTYGGGANYYGTMFSYNPVTGKDSIVINFNASVTATSNGSYPYGTLMLDPYNKMLYGMTYNGGPNSVGVIYRYNPYTGNDSVMVAFNGVSTIGENPYGELVYNPNDHLLYGLVYAGAGGSGGLIRFNPVTNKDTVLHIFKGGTDGASPTGDLIVVNRNNLKVSIAASNDTVYPCGSSTLTALGGTSYLWNTGATTASIVVSPAKQTTYSVQIKKGIYVKDTSITINVKRGSIISPASANLCSGGVQLSASTDSLYNWAPATALTCITCSNPVASPVSATTYTLTVTAKGGCISKDSVTITINKPLSAVISGFDTICLGGSTTLSVNSLGTYYQWSNGDTTTSVNVSPTIASPYWVIAKSAYGCPNDTDTVHIVVNPIPALHISAQYDTVSPYSLADVLSANPAGGVFSGKGVNGNNFYGYVAGTGIHTIVYTYNTGFGCQNSDSMYIYVTPAPAITPFDVLYGTTEMGGTNNDGIIFKYTISTGKDSVIHSFAGTDGKYPYHGELTINPANGWLYGMTEYGGKSNLGVMFAFNPATQKDSVLFSFSGTNGAKPKGGLVYNTYSGLMYGLTSTGGASNDGVIFSFNPATGKDSTCFSFNGTDGEHPQRTLMYDTYTGLYYGTTDSGGTSNYGTMFSFNTATNQENVLINFNKTNGSLPLGSLMVFPANKKIYGATAIGGTTNQGVIYMYDPATGKDTVIYNCTSANSNGYAPYGRLMYDSLMGVCYGLCTTGPGYSGTLYSFNPITNKDSVKAILNGSSLGEDPEGDLTLAPDGKLYFVNTLTGTEYGTINCYNPIEDADSLLTTLTGGTGTYPRGNLLFVNAGSEVLPLALSGPGQICIRDTAVMNVTGGTSYHWSTGSNATSVKLGPTVTTTYSVAVYKGAYERDSTFTIIVHALPVLTISAQSDSVAFNSTTDSLHGTPVGGVFTGEGVSGNNFNASTTKPGPHYIVYTYTNSNGCTYSDTTFIFVKFPPGALPDYLLYGTAESGGGDLWGAMYSYDLGTNTETVLWNNTSGTDAAIGTPAYDPLNKHVYFTIQGVVASRTPPVLFDYNTITKTTAVVGYNMYGTPIYDSTDGNIYVPGFDSIFRYTPGTNKIKGFHIDSGSIGTDRLTMVKGIFYGVSASGNDTDYIFKFNPATGKDSICYRIVDGAVTPNLAYDSANGLLYGVSERYDENGYIFSFNPSTNKYTAPLAIINGYSSSTGGPSFYNQGLMYYPPNGLLYGGAAVGGIHHDGNLFSFNPVNHYLKDVFDFSGGNGSWPEGNLLEIPTNGDLIGVTYEGGSGYGVVFEFNPQTGYCSGKIGFNVTNGAYPVNGLIPVQLGSIPTSLNNIHDSVSGELMSVYPDPFRTHTTIYFNEPGIHFIEVYDMVGKKVAEAQCYDQKYLFNAELASGMYFIKALDGKHNYLATRKILVQ